MTITTYYCDRCGADLAGLKASEVPYLVMSNHFRHTNKAEDITELCPDCARAFLELLNDFMKEGTAVRCKDCVFCDMYAAPGKGVAFICSQWFGEEVEEDHFCSYGKNGRWEQ